MTRQDSKRAMEYEVRVFENVRQKVGKKFYVKKALVAVGFRANLLQAAKGIRKSLAQNYSSHFRGSAPRCLSRRSSASPLHYTDLTDTTQTVCFCQGQTRLDRQNRLSQSLGHGPINKPSFLVAHTQKKRIRIKACE